MKTRMATFKRTLYIQLIMLLIATCYSMSTFATTVPKQAVQEQQRVETKTSTKPLLLAKGQAYVPPLKDCCTCRC